MAQKPITIIGAGIGGLTLARCLRKKGIQFTILDKLTSLPNYSYAITLYSRTYRPLLKILDMDETVFRNSIAVDATVGGVGRLWPENSPRRTDEDDGAFRAHRAKFEALLRESLEVKLGCTLVNVKTLHKEVELSFENGQSSRSDLVVGADGVHSQVRRLSLADSNPKVLPYVVFNGKREISPEVYQNAYASYMQGSNMLESRQGNALLQISITERTAERTRLNYTYSRPANDDDLLHKPGRATTGANEIPEEFFDEIQRLPDLPKPFSDIFDVPRMRKERMLHWLMRTTMVEIDELQRLANDGIVMIGDSVHAQPILGGAGANSAIIDGLELAEEIAMNGLDSLPNFYKIRYESWKQDVLDSEQRLKSMHTSQSNLDDSRTTTTIGRSSAL